MIQFGNDEIKEIYVGSDKIKEVYYGSEKVWGKIASIQDGYWVHKDTGVITYFGLEDSSIEDGIMSKPSWASDCSEVKIPSGVTGLGESCFSSSTALTSITITNSVTFIGRSCFYGCTALTSVIGLESTSCTALYNSCFNGCTALTSVSLPPTLTILDTYCFYKCESLTSITIPASVTSIYSSIFNYCLNLTSIYSLRSTAIVLSTNPFGSSSINYIGRNTYNQGVNMLYVPQGATGYDASNWLDPLQHPSKCGFTISYTL